jgi:hypothetical protein
MEFVNLEFTKNPQNLALEKMKWQVAVVPPVSVIEDGLGCREYVRVSHFYSWAIVAIYVVCFCAWVGPSRDYIMESPWRFLCYGAVWILMAFGVGNMAVLPNMEHLSCVLIGEGSFLGHLLWCHV